MKRSAPFALAILLVASTGFAHRLCNDGRVPVGVMNGLQYGTGKTPAERLKSQAAKLLEALRRTPPDAKLLVLPELSLTPYRNDAQEEFENAAQAREFAYELPKVGSLLLTDPFDKLAEIARSRRTFLQVGLLEKEKDSKNVYNTVVVVGPTGTLVAKHRKVNLVGPPHGTEPNYLTAGAHVPTQFDASSVGLGRVGVAICADIYESKNDPHLMEKFRTSGIDTLSVSADWLTAQDTDEGTRGWGPGDFYKETVRYLNGTESLKRADRYNAAKPWAKREIRQGTPIHLVVSNTTAQAPGAGGFAPDGQPIGYTQDPDLRWLAVCLPRARPAAGNKGVGMPSH